MNRNLAKVVFKPINSRLLRRTFSLSNLIDVSPEVAAALQARRPVVALESTIITHGMPFPHNYRTAISVEEIIRSQGAVPATVAILSGRIKVGLDRQVVLSLAEMKNSAVKTSTRDFPHVISNKLNGGTTVAGTVVVANAVGIQVFVTGGIGGVHRGGELSLDVSADLTELGRNPVAVVSSGVKSILDIGKTLEYLETQGVCVASYGPSTSFPAFYTRHSGHHAPYHATSPRHAANMIHALRQLGLKSGLLLAVPIPPEHAIGGEEGGVLMEAVINKALAEAKERGIIGKELTPFLLSRVSALTEGKSLAANIALIEHNAEVGARVAVDLHDLQASSDTNTTDTTHMVANTTDTTHMVANTTDKMTNTVKSMPVVIGGSILDYVIRVDEDSMQCDGRTHKGSIWPAGGGVARNVADCLGKLGLPPLLLSAVGNDQHGRFLLQQTLQHVDCRGVRVSATERTACYSVVTDRSGECRLGVGDMDVHSSITPAFVAQFADELRSSPLVVMDGNIPQDTVAYVLDLCWQAAVPVWYEPTDVKKASKPFHTDKWKALKFVSPNFNELKMMAQAFGSSVNAASNISESSLGQLLDEVYSLCLPVVEHGTTAVVTLGGRGVMIVRRGGADDQFYRDGTFIANPTSEASGRYYPADTVQHLANVSGAGDCFASGFMAAMLDGATEAQCVGNGLSAALQALHSVSAVPAHMAVSRLHNATFRSFQ